MRYLATLAPFCLALAPCPALAQTVPPQDDSIVVTGSREAPSNWRLAETDHVIVLSDGKQSELVRIAHNLERLHFLLSALLNQTGKRDDTRKLRVTLVGDNAEFEAMELRNLRARMGPYARAFVSERYYDPREDGAVMAASRYDQKAILQPGVSLANVISGIQMAPDQSAPPGSGAAGMSSIPYSGSAPAMTFAGMPGLGASNVNEFAVPISSEGRIYAGFAQHYLLTYLPAAYPRWYVDGFGELFATIRTNSDGSLDYGRPPEGYSRVLDWYSTPSIRDVLSGKLTDDAKASKAWTPFHAWSLAHMLFFSDVRRPQLARYLTAIAAGQPADKAVEAFGDLDKLQREFRAYDNRRVAFDRVTYPAELVTEPSVRALTQGQAAFLKGRLELGSRVEIPSPAPSGISAEELAKIDRARQNAVQDRDRWLARLRKDAARFRANLEAQLLLAEAECRSGNAAECIAVADRALELAPGNSDALGWKGMGEIQLAIAGPAANRTVALKAARRTIARANRANTENPVPLIAYYRSFADAGEPVPDIALEGLLKATDIVPAAPATRLMLGEAFARTGNPQAARRALRPVAEGAYDSPERVKARALLTTLAAG